MASWLKDNPTQRIKMTVINVVHAFNQSAKMGYSNAAHTGTDKGYVNDWRNKFPGMDYARGFAMNFEDQYFFPDEQGSTPYWWVLDQGNKFAFRGGGGDDWQRCRDYILARYTDGTLTAYTAQCRSPGVTVSVNGAVATVTVVNNESGAAVHYTIDGTIPSASSPVYTAPVSVNSSRLFRAQAVKAGMYKSRVVIRPVIVSGTGEANVAPQGTGYSWINDYLTADNSNANRTAHTGLNDNNTTSDVRLSAVARQAYADGESAFKYAKWHGAGVVWNTAQNISRVEYFQGTVTNDWWGGHGCYRWNIKMEITTDGATWVDADRWGYFKEFPFNRFYGNGTAGGGDADDFPASQVVPGKYDPITFFLGQVTAIRGFRIVGAWNVGITDNQADYINVRELKAYSGTVAVNDTRSVTTSGMVAGWNTVNATLAVSAAAGAEVNVTICDLTGRQVRTLSARAGSKGAEFALGSLARGSYVAHVGGAAGTSVSFCK